MVGTVKSGGRGEPRYPLCKLQLWSASRSLLNHQGTSYFQMENGFSFFPLIVNGQPPEHYHNVAERMKIIYKSTIVAIFHFYNFFFCELYIFSHNTNGLCLLMICAQPFPLNYAVAFLWCHPEQLVHRAGKWLSLM